MTIQLVYCGNSAIELRSEVHFAAREKGGTFVSVTGFQFTFFSFSMAYQKIDKEFVLSDSSENAYGYRLLTSGYQMGEFAKNPIGYYGHKKDDGVLVRWEDLQLADDKVTGKPVINMEHPRAQRTISEINDGFLNAASVGKLVFLEFELEDNPAEPTNPGMVVTKWYNKECSLVDNPANRNAMKVELEDSEGNELNLEDLTSVLKKAKIGMKKITLTITPEMAELINLSDDAAEQDVIAGIKELHSDKEALKVQCAKLETDLADVKTAEAKGKVEAVLEKYRTAKGLTNQEIKDLSDDYAGRPDVLEARLKNRANYKSVTDALNNSDIPAKFKDLEDKSFEEIHKSNRMAEFKAACPELYAQKFREKYGG